MIALTATTLFTPLERIEQPLLLVEDGVVVEVSSRAHREIPQKCRVADFGDSILVPGLIDIHIHGGAGHDVMEPGNDALPPVERLLASHGVTSYFPTTVTAPMDATLSALGRLADAIEAAERDPKLIYQSGRGRGEFISKARSSAIAGAGFILRRTCCSPRQQRLTASGRRRGDTSGC